MSPALLMDARGIRRLGRTFALAIMLAAPIFYFFPAPIAFTRPAHVPGWDWLYQLVWALDNTGNTLPSMHITFSTITVLLLWPQLSRWARPCFVLWFVLICLAVLFTWQHHVLDIITGVLLGLLCWRVVGPPKAAGFAWCP